MKECRISTIVLIIGLLSAISLIPSCAQSGGASLLLFLVIILIFILGIFCFVIIRTLYRREQKHDLMVEELKIGDRVITVDGIYGKLESINNESAILKVESGATIRVTKGGILSRKETP